MGIVFWLPCEGPAAPLKVHSNREHGALCVVQRPILNLFSTMLAVVVHNDHVMRHVSLEDGFQWVGDPPPPRILSLATLMGVDAAG